MKKLLLYLLFLTSAYNSQAQYTSFPDSGATWVNTLYLTEWMEWGPANVLYDVDNYCVNGEDTLIGLQSYTKVNYCNGAYKGALRDNGGQVFFVPADSLTEFLLYDFTVSVGSTLNNVYIHSTGNSPMLTDYTVMAIDSILINGNYHTRISLLDGGEWYEGIGCSAGLFAEAWTNVSGYYLELHCMSHNDEIFHPNYSAGNCALDVSINDQSLLTDLTIFPNPASNTLTISFSDHRKIDEIHFIDVMGNRIYPMAQEKQGIITADVSWLPAGIYFVKVVSADQQITRKIVKR